MKKSLVLTILCLALGLVLTACGDDDDDKSDEARTDQVDTKAPAGKSNVKKIDMKDTQFVPADQTVRAGNTVQWTNSDSVAHTVTKVDGPGPKFDSKNIDPGEAYERNFPTRGSYNYMCTIHPTQRGVLQVQ